MSILDLDLGVSRGELMKSVVLFNSRSLNSDTLYRKLLLSPNKMRGIIVQT